MGVTRIRDSEINVGCVVLRRALLVLFALACIQVQVMGRCQEGVSFQAITGSTHIACWTRWLVGEGRRAHRERWLWRRVKSFDYPRHFFCLPWRVFLSSSSSFSSSFRIFHLPLAPCGCGTQGQKEEKYIARPNPPLATHEGSR